MSKSPSFHSVTRAFDVLVRRGACAFPLSSRERTQTGRACFSRTSGLFYSPCAVKGFGRTQLAPASNAALCSPEHFPHIDGAST